MSLSKIKLVTFDATNTLLKFRVPPWEYYTTVARNYGFTGTADDVKCRLLDSYKMMWNKYPNFGKNNIKWDAWWRGVVKLTFDGQLPRSANVDTIASTLINDFTTSKCWYPAKGADKVLQLLRKQGISIGVISNFDPRLNDILRSFKFRNNLDFILTSYDSGFSKPDEKIFKLAIEKCKKVGLAFECLHIGDDMTKDYEGARAAGWHALLITENNKKIEKPPALNHVFKNLDELSIAIENNTLKF